MADDNFKSLPAIKCCVCNHFFVLEEGEQSNMVFEHFMVCMKGYVDKHLLHTQHLKEAMNGKDQV